MVNEDSLGGLHRRQPSKPKSFPSSGIVSYMVREEDSWLALHRFNEA